MVTPSDTKHPLHDICIVGGGLAGLALAIALRKSDFQVTVLERNEKLEEVGAGIQLHANICRLLHHLGVLEDVRLCAIEPTDLFIRSYRGEKLFHQPLNPGIEQIFEFPHLLVHRADIRRILYDAACHVGADIRFGVQVEAVDPQNGLVQLSGGEVHHTDLIVGADGDHSICREALLEAPDPPHSSGDSVFRMTVPQELMREDPELSPLLTTPSIHAWYGPGSHIVCYQLQSADIFNIVLTLPADVGSPIIGPQIVEIDILRRACQNWDNRIQKLLGLSDKALKWTLVQTRDLKKWHHDSGRLVLVGDSAHAMLPYLALGATMAIESACCLSELLAQRPTRGDMPGILETFNRIRASRIHQARQQSQSMHDWCQIGDGPEQLDRDRRFKEERPPRSDFPNPWAIPEWQREFWGFDMIQETRHHMREQPRL